MRSCDQSWDRTTPRNLALITPPLVPAAQFLPQTVEESELDEFGS